MKNIHVAMALLSFILFFSSCAISQQGKIQASTNNHPENYRNLLVRISGYNVYFVTLNRDMQLELIERAEYAI